MNSTDFHNFLWLSSVPLVRLNEQGVPDGNGSGCLVDYYGKRILLTVAHVTNDQKNWAIQKKYVPENGTLNHQLGAMNFLKKGSLSKPTLEDVDFAYVEVPSDLCAFRQEIEAPQNIVKSETPIRIHEPTFEDSPTADEDYGFCGIVLPSSESHFGLNYIGGELRVYVGLSFQRTEDDIHVFLLPFDHPGHEHFIGCSGAPIINRSGFVVALLSGGCIKTNEIYGISLNAYKSALDIYVGNI